MVLQKLNGIKVNDRIVSVEVTETKRVIVEDHVIVIATNRTKRFGNDGGNFRGVSQIQDVAEM